MRFSIRNITAFVFLLIFSAALQGQGIVGRWSGELEEAGLGLVFEISETEDGLQSTLDIPKQSVKGMAVGSTDFRDSTLVFSMPNLGAEYKGVLNEKNEFVGNFKQGMYSFPLVLVLGAPEPEMLRPQEPRAPFPYRTEEVVFRNEEAGLRFSGTLSAPEDAEEFPVVLIISGSGPQNRDGELFGHKPYLLLADQLTRNGLGVLRFDERGMGESEGEAASIHIESQVSDVQAAMKYLQSREDLNITKLGLIGHSIGGIIAPKLAVETQGIDFLVLLAAPALPGKEMLLLQKAEMERGMEVPEQQIELEQEIFGGAYDLVLEYDQDRAKLEDTLSSYFSDKYGPLATKEQIDPLVQQVMGEEFLSLIRSQPSDYLQRLELPVLAVWGSKDVQVAAEPNRAAMESIFRENGNGQVQLLVLEGLNHLFQEAETGLPNEYMEIEQTISPKALEVVGNWVREQAGL